MLGVMERPAGKTEADKWDAWRAVGGMRKTEAKRRYIECLIEVWWSVFFLSSRRGPRRGGVGAVGDRKSVV